MLLFVLFTVIGLTGCFTELDTHEWDELPISLSIRRNVRD